MENNMTELSLEMYNKAVKENMSVQAAVDTLKKYTDFRTLSQKIGAFSEGRDLKSFLIDGLCENHPEMKRDTVSRKVRNWLNDCNNSIKKKDAIELCFVMGLTVQESDSLVAMICQETLHWRDPDEIPYIFALSKGMSYTQAVRLHESVKSRIGDSDKKYDEKAFTDLVKKEIGKIETEQELIAYVAEIQHRLGKFHNTAYSLFCEMMAVLEEPELEDDDDYFGKSEKYSVGMILKAYMYRQQVPEIPDNRKRGLFSALQRSVSENWPGEAALSRMKNRREDVTRKVLILLFLATYDNEEGMYDDEDIEDPYYEKTRDEIFEEFYKKMNTMLLRCGFAPLDPRSPFDWMVIYCMCVEDVWETDTHMSEFLESLFTDDGEGNSLQI